MLFGVAIGWRALPDVESPLPVPRPSPRIPRALAVAAATLALVGLAGGCGSDATGDGRPTVVVTTTVLGSLVQDLVGDAADVEVLMPDGVDPHDYQPSAKDVGRLEDADVIVANGLDLEEGLGDALGNAQDGGTPVFQATDHVGLRVFGDGEEGADEHGPEDPHVWMDPLAMRGVIVALAPVLADEAGIDVRARATDLEARLTALDGEVRDTLADIPAARRRLVTGHESMGYFARRYDFELVGALIPSLSSQAQVSASNLAALRAQVEREGVPAIFTEVGTPAGVAEAIGDQTGARVIEVGTHALPDDGSYFTFVRDVAATVHDGLATEG